MPSLMSTAQRLLQAGQDRADRELAKTEKAPHEVGALRATVRNLCAELDAFEPEDGSIEVWFKGSPLWVHLAQEMIQANGYDISRFMSEEDKQAVITLAEEKQRDQWLEMAEETRAERRAA
jgi:hypothetical protein